MSATSARGSGDRREATDLGHFSGRRPLLSTREAGAYTGLGERYIRRLRAERRIPCVRIGGRVLFDPDDLDQLIEQHRRPAVVGPDGC